MSETTILTARINELEEKLAECKADNSFFLGAITMASVTLESALIEQNKGSEEALIYKAVQHLAPVWESDALRRALGTK